MAAVEQADVAEVDGLLEEHRRRDHLARDEVPCCPHVLPLLNSGEGEWRARDRVLYRRLEQWKRELRTLEEPKRILRGAVGPPVDRSETRLREERICIALREL